MLNNASTEAVAMRGQHLMPVSAISAAQKLCELSEWSLTNLKLQKSLYIAQMLHIGRYGVENSLLKDAFEAWDLGPVVPSLYHRVKIFGSLRIKNIFCDETESLDERAMECLEETFTATQGKTAAQLVAITHWEKGAWASHYEPNVRGIVIPNEDIKKEYDERQRQKPN